jgi:hypothetical protein
MPCVMFRSAMMRVALASGHSFCADVLYNEVRSSRRLSRFAAKRFQDAFVPSSRVLQRVPAPVAGWLRRRRLDWLSFMRGEVDGQRPHYVVRDTGAGMYDWCKQSLGLEYAFVNPDLVYHVVHLHGATRRALGEHYSMPLASAAEKEVQERLKTYGMDWAQLSAEAIRRTGGET